MISVNAFVLSPIERRSMTRHDPHKSEDQKFGEERPWLKEADRFDLSNAYTTII